MMKKIPWSRPDVGKDELVEIKDSFKNEWLTSGPKVKLFEQKCRSLILNCYIN